MENTKDKTFTVTELTEKIEQLNKEIPHRNSTFYAGFRYALSKIWAWAACGQNETQKGPDYGMERIPDIPPEYIAQRMGMSYGPICEALSGLLSAWKDEYKTWGI